MDKDLSKPLVTVFMAAYNSAPYISASIESVLHQPFTDFELLIVDDGSTDGTVAVVQGYKDMRIRLLRNDRNRGLTYTRNKGVKEARGKYLAILDSDDLALPDRLSLQATYMEANADVAVCGGQALIIDGEGKDMEHYPFMPTGRENMGMHLLFRNIFINPACMLRTAVVTSLGGYRDYAPAEDYDLYVRIAKRFPVAVLPDDLVKYRIHQSNISREKFAVARGQEKRILAEMQKSLGIDSEQFLDIHHRIYLEDFESVSLDSIYELFAALVKGNRETGVYPRSAFEQFIFLKGMSILKRKPKKYNALFFYFRQGIFRWEYFGAIDFIDMVKISLSGVWRHVKKGKN